MAASSRRADKSDSPGSTRTSARKRCPTCGEKYPLDFLVCPKDATALERPAGGDDPLIGEVLAGSFYITSLIGEGAMGRVYEAEHARLPRRFAIKVMHEELLRFPEAIARVEREAQAIARVNSDNVIDVIDLVRLPDGRPCLVTELLEGEELGALLDRRGKLPVAEAISIGRQVCRGLAAAHAVNVLHRDLKPTNLFLAKRGDAKPVAKILDFGVAKMSDGAQLTLTGMVLGTPAYMAPEQARGDKDVDARADVYSLGAVLYRMLTGSPPFEGDDPATLLAQVMSEDPRPIRAIEPSIPERIEKLVMRTLSRKREARPKTVADLELDLAMVDPEEIERAAEASGWRAPETRVAANVVPDRATAGTRDTVIDPPSPQPQPSLATFPLGGSRRASVAVVSALGGLVVATVVQSTSLTMELTSARTKGAPDVTPLALAGALSAVVVIAIAARSLAAAWNRPTDMRRLGSAAAISSFVILAIAGLVAIAICDIPIAGIRLDPHVERKAELAAAVVSLTTAFVVLWARTRPDL